MCQNAAREEHLKGMFPEFYAPGSAGCTSLAAGLERANALQREPGKTAGGRYRTCTACCIAHDCKAGVATGVCMKAASRHGAPYCAVRVEGS